jgi:hypothetical protein
MKEKKKTGDIYKSVLSGEAIAFVQFPRWSKKQFLTI